MSNHEKFILEDLPKYAVVNSTNYYEESETDKLITEVVTEHISKIVDETINAVPKNPNDTSDAVSPVPASVSIVETQKVDLELLKKEAFDKGYAEAKLNYSKQSEELHGDINLSNLLKEKLQTIIPSTEIDEQISIVSAEAITAIAKKLHLILPADFQEILKQGLLKKLEGFYKEGVITITIHPDRYEFCKEILQSDEIPSKFKDNFEIVQDGKLSRDDCSLEWLNTRLEYNQEQLSAEIDKIIEQLKSTTSR